MSTIPAQREIKPYPPEAIRAVRDLQIWMCAKSCSTTALATAIDYAKSTVSKVLRGLYGDPVPVLAKALAHAGLPVPAAWPQPPQVVPKAEPVPPASQVVPPSLPTREVSSCWVPGAAIDEAKPERAQILKRLARYSSQAPLPVADLVKSIGDTPAVHTALQALIAAREVMQATVTTKGKSIVVVYPVGRVPVPRPGPKAGAKPRAPAVVITPSTHAKSVHRGTTA